jgi:predicted ATP-dependent endonuclease of OLD family
MLLRPPRLPALPVLLGVDTDRQGRTDTDNPGALSSLATLADGLLATPGGLSIILPARPGPLLPHPACSVTLRGIVDTGLVQLKPLNILVGANSSGKSTFLRAFPLLKQSIETATESPILWFGQYVDFGTIDSAVNRRAPEKSIDFQFSFNLEPESGRRGLFDDYEDYEDSFIPLDVIPVKVKIKLTKAEHKQGSRVGGCEIETLGYKIDLAFDDNGLVTRFVVGEFNALAAKPDLRLANVAYFIPSVIAPDEKQAQRQIVYQPYRSIQPRRAIRQSVFKEHIFTEVILEEMRDLFHGNTAQNTAVFIAKSMQIGSPQAMVAHLEGMRNNNSWKKRVRDLSSDPQKLKSITERVLAEATPCILEVADNLIAQFAANITYMGPLRAIASRYYRAQDLSVREVDFRGENLAMFIRSLSEAEKGEFSAFAKEHFNIKVRSKDDGGHVEIHVAQGDSANSVNLADAGFGYSQMLPLIAQVWSTHSIVKRSKRQAKLSVYPPLVAIEQPELHLHPAHQAKLADMFAGTISSLRALGTEVRMIIETHSEALVNRIGELVNC